MFFLLSREELLLTKLFILLFSIKFIFGIGKW